MTKNQENCWIRWGSTKSSNAFYIPFNVYITPQCSFAYKTLDEVFTSIVHKCCLIHDSVIFTICFHLPPTTNKNKNRKMKLRTPLTQTDKMIFFFCWNCILSICKINFSFHIAFYASHIMANSIAFARIPSKPNENVQLGNERTEQIEKNINRSWANMFHHQLFVQSLAH